MHIYLEITLITYRWLPVLLVCESWRTEYRAVLRLEY